MQDGILTVRALTEQLRRSLEGRFPFVWVRGEVSNLSRPGSGHIYFSLKDQDAQLQCVWFRGQQHQAEQGQSFDPLTGEVFDSPRPPPLELLRNGLDMLCAGRISVYAPRGQYQLLVELVRPVGRGLLAQAFEERKRRLAEAGYFAQERKRLPPWNPQRVALITSPGGAAVHDFLELARDRGSGAQIRLFPTSVQGGEAAPEIVRALETANAQDWAQVIVLIRGGGSLEDLWAFNEDAVAEAVFHSRPPVVAGIGHEVDVTLADLTADLRAATPSHAAQLLWPLRAELRQRLDETVVALRRAFAARLEREELALRERENALRWFSPQRHQARLAEQLARLSLALRRAARQWLADKGRVLEGLGWSRRGALAPGQLDTRQARLSLLRGALDAALPRHLSDAEHTLALARNRLRTAGGVWLENRFRRMESLETALAASDPLAPLHRGYALVRTAQGGILRSVGQTAPGRDIEVRLADGRLVAAVRSVSPDAAQSGEENT
ncbi:exodeoxyribonuclease VII large subunit [uncultured Desulfovibrio sp.]|uniref:exodeoxyribonuclease VII large subunit n=1 Tax=uncultured Desulfovibrio sp. TaxID=167968 RepID=UPI002603AD68|nr:exodeoxyribonuclease VII large subunit [uncultured Desulfovibrio sp.]